MTETTRQIRVLVADDHGLIREGIRLALADDPDIEIVAEAGRGEEVLPRARESRPDIVLLDIKMPGMDGLEVLQREGDEQVRVLFPWARIDRVTQRGANVAAIYTY